MASACLAVVVKQQCHEQIMKAISNIACGCLVLGAITALLVSSAPGSQGDQDQVRQLQRLVITLTNRVDELERRASSEPAADDLVGTRPIDELNRRVSAMEAAVITLSDNVRTLTETSHLLEQDVARIKSTASSPNVAWQVESYLKTQASDAARRAAEEQRRAAEESNRWLKSFDGSHNH